MFITFQLIKLINAFNFCFNVFSIVHTLFSRKKNNRKEKRKREKEQWCERSITYSHHHHHHFKIIYFLLKLQWNLITCKNWWCITRFKVIRGGIDFGYQRRNLNKWSSLNQLYTLFHLNICSQIDNENWIFCECDTRVVSDAWILF